MEFKTKVFDELTSRELYEIVRARTEVFLLEQKIICQDFDRVDYDSLHCFLEDGGEVVAYLRAFVDEKGEIRIGRVLSTTHKIGLGGTLMKSSIPEIRKHFGKNKISLHAQKQAQGFYEKLGFITCSDEFIEDGVIHVEMILDEQSASNERRF